MYGQRVIKPSDMYNNVEEHGLQIEKADKFNNYYGQYILNENAKNHSRVFNHIDDGLNKNYEQHKENLSATVIRPDGVTRPEGVEASPLPMDNSKFAQEEAEKRHYELAMKNQAVFEEDRRRGEQEAMQKEQEEWEKKQNEMYEQVKQLEEMKLMRE
jgi:hypothetical protein